MPQREGARYFDARDGLAYSHRGQVDRGSSRGLRRVIEAIHAEIHAGALARVPAR